MSSDSEDCPRSERQAEQAAAAGAGRAQDMGPAVESFTAEVVRLAGACAAPTDFAEKCIPELLAAIAERRAGDWSALCAGSEAAAAAVLTRLSEEFPLTFHGLRSHPAFQRDAVHLARCTMVLTRCAIRLFAAALPTVFHPDYDSSRPLFRRPSEAGAHLLQMTAGGQEGQQQKGTDWFMSPGGQMVLRQLNENARDDGKPSHRAEHLAAATPAQQWHADPVKRVAKDVAFAVQLMLPCLVMGRQVNENPDEHIGKAIGAPFCAALPLTLQYVWKEVPLSLPKCPVLARVLELRYPSEPELPRSLQYVLSKKPKKAGADSKGAAERPRPAAPAALTRAARPAPAAASRQVGPSQAPVWRSLDRTRQQALFKPPPGLVYVKGGPLSKKRVSGGSSQNPPGVVAPPELPVKRMRLDSPEKPPPLTRGGGARALFMAEPLAVSQGAAPAPAALPRTSRPLTQ